MNNYVKYNENDISIASDIQKKMSLSKHLLWDIDSEHIDYNQSAFYIIKKVLQFGLYSDWKEISRYYGLNKIVDVAVKIRDLDLKTASFLSIISGVDKNNFICYTSNQSSLRHWNF